MPYFDAASAAPLHPVARQALLAALDEGWADPARLYREGRRARLLLDAAREAAADAVGCRPDELVFTPSGTRALHDGIAGALAGRRRAGRHLVVSAVEHSAVLHSAAVHEAAGGTVTEVAVDRTGRVGAGAYAAALRPDTALAVLQSANHEVGTVQPVAEVAEACREAGVPLLVDAAQSLGWEPVGGGWSLLTASAHKWGGPSGVGLLAVRKGVRYAPQHPVDERESGRAPGFPDLPAVVAAAASLRAVRQEAAEEAARLRALVDRIRARVPELVPDVEVVGDPARRLPHLVTFSCLYVDGEALLHALDREGFSVSSGSSCTSSTLTPSHVLRAMGVLTEGNVRVSLPRGTAPEEVDRFLGVLPGVVAEVRGALGAPAAGAGSPSGEGELVVDSLGKRCPIPVIELARAFGDAPVGGLVTVLSDDEAARLDIPAWCEMRGQEYVGERPVPGGVAYTVRRRS
ncbi:cysteine desulfurase/sulfurtransferase TusA family protein [Streptomyces morookaense]|uniref:Aminotransferase class V-fold PLP-dependent enzyme n=1 Tax=Streptomyces morookaense TaxID=1970 RepID=A0A7Y7B644_STRMO|nr:cysteine desulfurase/sulfurtransferase TusA family protein [Streptomyces morookaense]NVK79670.1 aminotransferase class V-fold PLP-dependent enzyme [Streptomyces morookaense]GHF32327.1 aminotransferase [Streptomyces morookaense]